MSTALASHQAAVRPPHALFDLTPITPIIGAEVTTIDLDDVLDDGTVAALREALVRHKVLVSHEHVDDGGHRPAAPAATPSPCAAALPGATGSASPPALAWT